MKLEEAQEIFEQAIEAYKNDQINYAIELFSKIEKTFVESNELYARAQFHLGNLMDDLKRYEEAEKAYRNVLKEDRAESYANAQFNLGILLKQQKRVLDAEKAYRNVLREDKVKTYASAQLNLGNLLDDLNRYEEAEDAYKNIFRDDNSEAYASAQLNLGRLLYSLNRYEEAEVAFKSVLREDRVRSYAKAQFNLGILLKQQKRFSEAEKAYKNVLRKDWAESYANAQVNLGNLFLQQKRIGEAEQAYKNIKYKDSAKQYASSQLSLGFLYNQQNKIDVAKKHFRNVKRSDFSLAYTYARFSLWLTTGNIIYLKQISLADDKDKYFSAQFQLGELEYSSEFPRLQEILNYWDNVQETSEWHHKVVYKSYLIRKILNIQNGMSKKLIEIFKKVDSLLSSLVIKNENENLIAHYTSPNVAKLLIAQKVCGFSDNSKMRLNTIDLMNDPTEGEILNHYLDISSDLISTNDQAFMGCFTLHHDSLNQFRLYGKEDQKEGSGLSLILSEEFFEQENSFSHIRLQGSNSPASEGLQIKGDDKSDEEKKVVTIEEKVNDKIIQKLPLYRCVYIDPDSKLIEISHREEWTFCREEKNAKSNKWNDYLNKIVSLRSEVRDEFENLEDLIKPLYQNISGDVRKHSNEAELLAEILLPLRFLIKHMAFKEEQECRVVYVTQWDDELVQYDEQSKRFYIDYGHDVATHLKKIYLGPHALHEKNIFEYLCSHAKKNNRTEYEVKIKISHNPLR